MSHPKTSHLALSGARIDVFASEARDGFERNSVGRVILNKSTGESLGDYEKIGINQITDRIWFVEGTFDGVAYAAPSGRQYGMAVAEGETKLVLDILFKQSLDSPGVSYLIRTPKDITEIDIHRLLDTLEGRSFKATAIVASIDQGLRFWNFKSFYSSDEIRKGFAFPEGTFRGVPVLHSRLLPDGMILAVDRGELGTLEVKKDFDILVSDISDPNLRESIRKQLPHLTSSDLDEKVQVLCYEVIKPRVLDQGACEILATADTELKIRKVRD